MLFREFLILIVILFVCLVRFVDDETEFSEEDVKESCLEAPDPLTFKPNLFITTALNQTKVECTWDETSRDRLAITMKKYTEDELKSLNLNNLIATSSDEDSDDDDDAENGNKSSAGANNKASVEKEKTLVAGQASDKSKKSKK